MESYQFAPDVPAANLQSVRHFRRVLRDHRHLPDGRRGRCSVGSLYGLPPVDVGPTARNTGEESGRGCAGMSPADI